MNVIRRNREKPTRPRRSYGPREPRVGPGLKGGRRSAGTASVEENAEGKGKHMVEKGKEKTGEAAKEAVKKDEESAKKEVGRSPGPAPLGGGDQKPNLAAGSKVEAVGDEGDPGLSRDGRVRRLSRREPVHGGDAEPGS